MTNMETAIDAEERHDLVNVTVSETVPWRADWECSCGFVGFASRTHPGENIHARARHNWRAHRYKRTR